MAISAAQVKDLRERTGAGFMECKRVLVETKGNVEAAIAAMRKSGQAKAVKKAGRIAAEGLIVIKVNAARQSAVMVELNCETDFVARDKSFQAFAEQLAERALAQETSSVDALLKTSLADDPGKTIEDACHELLSKLGENIKIRRLALLQSTGMIASYRHGTRIGVLVDLSKQDAELGKDVAMHIAATSPQAVKPEDVPADLIAKERDIFVAQAAASGKPADIIDKMVTGRINKFLNEVSLLKQPFVKDPNQTIAQLLQKAQVEVLQFIRYQVGEGIDKQETDFAAQVMAQVQGE